MRKRTWLVLCTLITITFVVLFWTGGFHYAAAIRSWRFEPLNHADFGTIHSDRAMRLILDSLETYGLPVDDASEIRLWICWERPEIPPIVVVQIRYEVEQILRYPKMSGYDRMRIVGMLSSPGGSLLPGDTRGWLGPEYLDESPITFVNGFEAAEDVISATYVSHENDASDTAIAFGLFQTGGTLSSSLAGFVASGDSQLESLFAPQPDWPMPRYHEVRIQGDE